MILYHISSDFLGKEITLAPRKCSEEDDCPPRICTAPSVAQCLIAIPSANLDGRKPIYVYKTQAKKFTKGTEWDTPVTQEKWLRTPHTFKLVNKLSKFVTVMTRIWVYGENSGISDNHLTRAERLALTQIKLQGMERFLMINAPDEVREV